MDPLLSVSQAARMVGVTRRHLQRQIQDGELTTFEGSLRLSELQRAYPDMQPDDSAMLEKTRRFRAAAGMKRADSRDPERLATEVHRLRLELVKANEQLGAYRQLANETRYRLEALEAQCNHREANLLQTVLGWYLHQLKLRERS